MRNGGIVIEFFRKVKKKHRGGILYNLGYELYVRLYTKAIGRKVLNFFLRRRELPENLVFLVGCYNSGTTILRDILRSHPDVSGMPREGVRFTDVFPDMQEGGWVRMAYANRHLEQASVDVLTARRKLSKDWGYWYSGSGLFLEKSITHAYRVDFLREVFPAAKFIFLARDGYCSTEGVLRRAKPQGDAAKVVGSEYSASLVAKQWVDINQKILKNKDADGSYFLKFEDFIKRPEEKLSELFGFLDLDDSCLEASEGIVVLGGKKFHILDPNAASRKRFPRAQLREFNEVAGPMLGLLGYEVLKDENDSD